MRIGRRKWLMVVLLGLFCLAVVVTRTMWEGRAALQRGDAAMKAGDIEGAVEGWRRSARWYLPVASHVTEAFERLEELGQTAEKAGDGPIALLAWRAIRRSILATRSFYTPHEDRLENANRAIARLMVLEEKRLAQEQEGDREAYHYQLLRRDRLPSAGWSIIAILGLLMWLGGGFAFALRGVSDDDRLVPRMAAWSAACVVVGLLVWMVGLYKA